MQRVLDDVDQRLADEDLARAVVANGWGLLELRPMRISLEDIFLQLTTDEQRTAEREPERGTEPMEPTQLTKLRCQLLETLPECWLQIFHFVKHS